MTEAEVRQIMGRHSEATGRPAQRGIRDSLVYRHSGDGAFDSDLGIISFSSNRVESVEFSPD
jgi:hypothetical protein